MALTIWFGAGLGLVAALAVLGGLTVGLARGPAGWPRWAGLVVAAAGLLACPLVVPPGAPTPAGVWPAGLVRFLVGCAAALTFFKLLDLARDPAPDVRALLAFVRVPGGAVRRALAREPRPAPREALRQAGRGGLVALAGGLLCAAAWSTSAPARAAFLLEHALRAAAFFTVVLGVAALTTNLARAFGAPARDVFDRPYAAVTPADFWRRYNRIVGQAFAENVFLPAGGRRAPVRATLLTFLASALLHEWLFGVATGRVEGYQTAFFLLQGVAVAATLRARPRTPAGRAVGWALTLAFNLVTSVLFFTSVDRALPFWTR